MADKFHAEWLTAHYSGRPKPTYADLARDYWEVVEIHTKAAVVEYGNDLDTEKFGSGFPTGSSPSSKLEVENSKPLSDSDASFPSQYYHDSWWNLTKLPSAPGSLLQHIKTSITGVNVPWLYIGMLFSSFCW